MKDIITSIVILLSTLLPCGNAADKPAAALSDTQRDSGKAGQQARGTRGDAAGHAPL